MIQAGIFKEWSKDRQDEPITEVKLETLAHDVLLRDMDVKLVDVMHAAASVDIVRLCKKTVGREQKFIPVNEFREVLQGLRKPSSQLYDHLMGEVLKAGLVEDGKIYFAKPDNTVKLAEIIFPVEEFKSKLEVYQDVASLSDQT